MTDYAAIARKAWTGWTDRELRALRARTRTVVADGFLGRAEQKKAKSQIRAITNELDARKAEVARDAS